MLRRHEPLDHQCRAQHLFRHHDHPHPDAHLPAVSVARKEKSSSLRRLWPGRIHGKLESRRGSSRMPGIPVYHSKHHPEFWRLHLAQIRFCLLFSTNSTASTNRLALTGPFGTSANLPRL